jgi:hypothetical protein
MRFAYYLSKILKKTSSFLLLPSFPSSLYISSQYIYPETDYNSKTQSYAELVIRKILAF